MSGDISQSIEEVYKKLLTERKDEGLTICLNHFGSFTQDLIYGMASALEELLVSFGESKRIIKRTFSILIEGLQNITIHGFRDSQDNQPAFLIVCRAKDNFSILFGNTIENTSIHLIKDYLEHLNNLDSEQLKSKYRQVLQNETPLYRGGAGLGFLSILLKSDGNLSFDMLPISNTLSCFCVQVTLNRN